MKKPTLLITAGPTRERIDPVRFISNYSTGTFGYAFAHEAVRRGCNVVLISGPVSLEPPRGVRLIRVESALDMRKAVLREFRKADCVIMAAAVSDWRPAAFSKEKMKKKPGKRRYIPLVENPDILAELGRKKRERIIVGFALETGELEKNAVKKLLSKDADFIIANRLEPKKDVFGDIHTKVVIIDKYGNKEELPRKPKMVLAKIILDRVLKGTI